MRFSLTLSSLLLAASAWAQDIALPPETTTLPSGLKIEYTKLVSCSRKSRNGDKLHVQYRGTLVDGTEFDTSYGGDAFTFKLGMHQVIRGWDIGLVDMCIGDARRLTIPADLGYGNRGAPPYIKPGDTLIFDTELMGIDGVKAEIAEEHAVNTPPINATTEVVQSGDAAKEELKEEMKGPDGGPHHGHDEDGNGECRLLGPFAIVVQGGLGALALMVLVVKRLRERPQRPVKIWFFDVSKQVAGSVLLHVVNLLMSMLSSGDFDVQKATTFVSVETQKGQPNPCSFYLLNLAVDTTIGIPILVLLLRVVHALAYYTPLANPPESLKSGHYGNPAHVSWWIKQSILYFTALILMKLCVFLIFQLFPWLGWVGDWALRWTEGKEWLQILFVMLIFPLIMNALQYWIVDSFIKDRTGGWQEYEQVGTVEDDDDEGRGLMGSRGHLDDEAEDDHITMLDKEASGKMKTLREENLTPIPSYEVDTSSGSSGGSKRSHSKAGKDN